MDLGRREEERAPNGCRPEVDAAGGVLAENGGEWDQISQGDSFEIPMVRGWAYFGEWAGVGWVYGPMRWTERWAGIRRVYGSV